LEDLVLRLPVDHGYNDKMQMRFFIRGLVPQRLKTYVKGIIPNTLNAAYRRAKLWEEVNFEDNYRVAIQSQPQMRPNRNERVDPAVLTQNPYLPISYVLPNAIQVSIPSTLPINRGPVQIQSIGQIVPEQSKLEAQLLDLSYKFEDLTVHVNNATEKKGQPPNDRTNIWCTNCKGQGHMLLDCPSPPSLPPKCRFWGGKHDIETC